DIRDARELMVGENTPCGKLHQNMVVGQHAVEICSPAAMLWYCSALPAMQPLWQRALELPRPWHIIIYGDEIGAGNALAHVQNRKSWGIYWTIAEFGPQDAWFQLATMRAKTANDIQPHGLTMLLDAILAQFWPDQGHNFSAGISLRLRPDGATELIQMDLGIYIQPLQRSPHSTQDYLAYMCTCIYPLRLLASLQRLCRIAAEDAIHRLIGMKGSSGIKPCFTCRNVFLKGEVRDIVASDATGVAVHHSEPDASRLQPMTAPLLDAICNRLIEGVNIANKGESQELERRLGWNWDPHLPERVRKLKPLETVMFDWMHCIFVNGTYNILVFQMFRRLKGYWARADAYFQDWSFPGCHSISPDTCAIFGEKRV
ncbi:unnamed protein product, partial [Prorocentrum cordatum]